MSKSSKPRGYKRHVIEAIFDDRWIVDEHRLREARVTLDDVKKYIEKYITESRNNRIRGNTNPPNFFKDFVRNTKSANLNWPSSVFERGYTGRQLTGEGFCFEFVPVVAGQVGPFPGDDVILPDLSGPSHVVESLSLPLAARRLGRRDEPWLTQVLVKLRVVETHFALSSARTMMHIDHLQMSIKLSGKGSEVDSVYLCIEKTKQGPREAIITCEAKGVRDDILTTQIVKQVKAIFSLSTITQEVVIPIAVKILAASKVAVVEFDAVSRSDASTLSTLRVAKSALYEFRPPVEGVS